TVAITGGGFLDPAFGLGQGFDRYRYWPEPPGPASNEELRTGVSRALEWLRDDSRAPWFLFLHSYETHAPYRPRRPYFEQFHGGGFEHAIGYANSSSAATGFQLTKEPVLRRPGHPDASLPPDQRATLIDLYDSGIAFADDQIRRLLDALERSGRDRDTLVVLTSDHGEALGEKGLAGHVTNYDFNLMVPLVVRLPDGRHGGTRVEQQVSTAQLPATLLDLVGLPPYPGLRGPSLRPAVEGRRQASRQLAWSYAANSNHGVSLRVDNRWKLIYQNSAFEPIATRRELYDLRADPTESTDLWSTAPPELEGLGRLIEDKLEDRLVGSRVVLINRSAAPLRGWMQGDCLAVTRVKIRWTDDPPGLMWDEAQVALRFDVAPGDTVHFEVEPWVDPFFELGIEHAGGEALFDAAVETLPGVWSVGFDGTAWHRSAADHEADAQQVIRVTWADQAVVGRDPSLDDDELRRQLEALGYIQ
ncbi:MAG: sulfatase-like hydrolase/transferase, partial [Acidobacteriota bacterium]